MFRLDKKSLVEEHLQKWVEEDRFLSNCLRTENKYGDKRLCKRLEQELQIAEKEKERERMEFERQQRLLEEEKKERARQETEKENAEAARLTKYRQFVRENSLELRELQSKLTLAYVTKCQVNQISEKQTQLAEMRAKELEDTRKLELHIRAEEMEAQKEEEREYKKQLIYREDLEEQLRDKHARIERDAMIQFLKEKEMIDEIVRKIMEEDRQQMQEEFQKKTKFRETISDFIKVQQELKKVQEALMQEENAKILECVEQMDRRIKETEKKFKERRQQVENYQEAARITLPRYRKDNLKEEELRKDLELAELEAEQRLKERKAFEEGLKRQVELRRSLEFQLKSREEREQAEKLEELTFRHDMLTRLAEQERIDQMTAQRKRIVQLEHRKMVEKMIQERQKAREKDKLSKLEELEAMKAAEKVLQDVIDQERQKMIEEHAKKLLGFLPKGLLKQHKV